MNDVPTPTREAPLFRFNSPGFNRSKYLALFTLHELEKKRAIQPISTCFTSILVFATGRCFARCHAGFGGNMRIQL